MKVFVIMANDSPECVVSDERAAKEFCRLKREHPSNLYRSGRLTLYRIHYRFYNFELDGPA